MSDEKRPNKSIGLSVSAEVYDEIVKRAQGGSIGGWCRQVIEEALKPCPEPNSDQLVKAALSKDQETLQALDDKGNVLDAIVQPKPLKYQFGTKVEPRPGIGGLG